MMKKIFFGLILSAIFSPSLAGAMILEYGYDYDWVQIIALSLLVMTIMILVWLISPLGITFTACSLAQFLVKNKPVRIVAWIFQSLIFVFTFLLGILGILWSQSGYGEEKYIILISSISAAVIVCLSIIGIIISQIIWQKKR